MSLNSHEKDSLDLEKLDRVLEEMKDYILEPAASGLMDLIGEARIGMEFIPVKYDSLYGCLGGFESEVGKGSIQPMTRVLTVYIFLTGLMAGRKYWSDETSGPQNEKLYEQRIDYELE